MESLTDPERRDMVPLTENQRRALDYLEAISDTAAEIDDRTEHLRELREKARGAGGYDLTTSRGRHGDHVDRVGRAAARIVDAENALSGLIEKYCAQYREAAALINQLDNVNDFVFLRARYFQRQKMEDIAVTLDVATAYVYRIRLRALEALGELLNGSGGGDTHKQNT